MEQKTLREKIEDMGKYLIISQPVSAMLVVIFGKDLGPENAAVVVAGLAATINAILVILNNRFHLF